MTTFLGGEEFSQDGSSLSETHFASTRVYPLIHIIKKDAIENIDTALTWEQLTASDVNFTIIRPLVLKYGRLKNLALVYACLVVRAHFRRLAEDNLAHSGLNHSRSLMCELLAMKCLRLFATNYFELAAALTHSWNPLTGAPPESVNLIKKTLAMRKSDDVDILSSALEMAISTDSKRFTSLPSTQAVVNDIYSGRIIFTTISTNSLVADNYKQHKIDIYDCRKAPILDHYRLRVPRYSRFLQIINFTVLLTLFLLCLTNKDLRIVTIYEKIFILFGAAFALAEYTASREYGLHIYLANIWNVFDTTFIFIGCVYLIFRIRGLMYDDVWSSSVAFDVLSCGACILFPRLAFFAISNNVVVLALRGMITDFVFFMTIASICFSGLLFTLWELAQLTPGNHWTIKSIAWLLLQIWFDDRGKRSRGPPIVIVSGNTSLTFQQAESFHPLFGPILMVTFAALSNTLLITILISILSNTFARIDANAIEEHLFQFTISTIEGVKTEALFSYQPPFNLLAYTVLAPLSWFVSPRTLHSANVFLIRVTSFPILLIIAAYERQVAFTSGSKFRRKSTKVAKYLAHRFPRKSATLIEAIVGTPPTADTGESLLDEEIRSDLFASTVESRDIFRNSKYFGPSEHADEQEQPQHNTSSGSRVWDRENAPFSRVAGTGTQAPPPPSPLQKLFSRRPLSLIERSAGASEETFENLSGNMIKLQHALDQINTDSIPKLAGQISELHERQARIESLLLTLTRSLRGEGIDNIRRNGTF